MIRVVTTILHSGLPWAWPRCHVQKPLVQITILSELSHNDAKYKGRWKDGPEGDFRVRSAHGESSVSKSLHSILNLSSHAMVFIQII